MKCVRVAWCCSPFRFPSVLLHPPPLAREFIASYGEMFRRSGVAAKEDNHSGRRRRERRIGNVSTDCAESTAILRF
jgi:hypothetical protein